jgi:hypothetical protein
MALVLLNSVFFPNSGFVLRSLIPIKYQNALLEFELFFI